MKIFNIWDGKKTEVIIYYIIIIISIYFEVVFSVTIYMTTYFLYIEKIK